MKITTHSLVSTTLDWAVAEANKIETYFVNGVILIHQADSDGGDITYSPSTDWAQGGPIIEREKIQLSTLSKDKEWRAALIYGADFIQYAETPLKAAMRCYVQSKLGDEVEIPDELL